MAGRVDIGDARRRGRLEPAPPHRALHRRVRRRSEAARPRAALRAVEGDARATRPADAGQHRRRVRLRRPGAHGAGLARHSPVPARRSGWPTNSSHSSKTTSVGRADDGLMECNRVAVPQLPRRPGGVRLPHRGVRLRRDARRPRRDRRRRRPRRAALAGGRRRDVRHGRSRRQRVLPAADELRVGVRRHGRSARRVRPGGRRRSDDRPRDARRGLRLDRLQRARSRGQHLELRHLRAASD